VLHEDLERHAVEFQRHAVIRAIAGEPSALLGGPRPERARETTGLSWQVLDAALSQRAAIASVQRGERVVIQGPPGTGKSQTITNLIAESLGHGQTVLFVSEKKAALRVVSQRLAATGLGEFCLELHDDALEEAEIVRDLADRSGMGMPRNESILPELQHLAGLADPGALAHLRRELDAYYDAFCGDTTPFGGSTYDVIGQLAHLADAPLVRFEYDPAVSGGVTAARLTEFERTLADLLQVAPIVREPDRHPWRHIEPVMVQADPTTRYRLVERLVELTSTATGLLEQQWSTRRAWGLPPDSTLAGARERGSAAAAGAARRMRGGRCVRILAGLVPGNQLQPGPFARGAPDRGRRASPRTPE